MATTLPSPNSSPSAVPPASTITPTQPSSPPLNPSSATNTSSPPPASSSQPPLTSPPPAAGASPPLPPTTSPPPQSGSPAPVPPANVPPPSSNSPPPPSNQPQISTPPTSNPPEPSPPPPSSPPPVGTLPPPSSDPPANSPPPSSPSSPPPPPSDPPTTPLPSSSPPPPLSDPPANSPPPSSPSSPPPPPSDPPTAPLPPSSPPPPSLPAPNPSPSSQPPQNSPSPPSSTPPPNPPPTPATIPVENSPSPSASNPPENLTPPLPSVPPSNSTPPSNPPPISPTPSNSSSNPPSHVTVSPPPPPSLVPPFSPSPPPSQFPIPPSDNRTTNNSDGNVPENSNSEGNGGLGTGGLVAIGLALGFILLSLIGAAAWYMRKRKKKFSGLNGGYIMPTSVGSSPYSGSSPGKHTSAPLLGSGSGSDFVYHSAEPGRLGNSRLLFTYKELSDATNGFSAQNLLGEGGSGSVYKGYLVDGREVAVKLQRFGGGQQEQEVKAEVQMISHIHHRNLVSLMGYCIYENQGLLVYEYVTNSTLYFHLHGEGRPVMDWATRLKIAVGAARGIAYLHEDCHPRIIHRDIKSSNILLDNNFEALVSDFGLAKLALDPITHVTTHIMGTFGYMAPEYASCGKSTEKSDVFSFGVVLLELITGRKAVDESQPLGEECLFEWAGPLLNHAVTAEEFEELIDPRLEKNYTDGEMFLMIEAAAACVRHTAARRPRMVQVVRAFESLATEDLTNGMRVGESEIYNSPLQSSEIRSLQRMAFGSQGHSTVFFSQSSCNS